MSSRFTQRHAGISVKPEEGPTPVALYPTRDEASFITGQVCDAGGVPMMT
jgi:hypothetical protein